MKTTTATIIEQQSTAIEQQSLSAYDSTNSRSESSLETLDDTELELETIMFEELAQGLPSDIPMADF